MSIESNDAWYAEDDEFLGEFDSFSEAIIKTGGAQDLELDVVGNPTDLDITLNGVPRKHFDNMDDAWYFYDAVWDATKAKLLHYLGVA